MRVSVTLLVISLLGVLAGGWLTGRVGFGLCVIADSVFVGVWGFLRDDGSGERAEPQAYETSSLADIFEHARRAG